MVSYKTYTSACYIQDTAIPFGNTLCTDIRWILLSQTNTVYSVKIVHGNNPLSRWSNGVESNCSQQRWFYKRFTRHDFLNDRYVPGEDSNGITVYSVCISSLFKNKLNIAYCSNSGQGAKHKFYSSSLSVRIKLFGLFWPHN